MKALIWKEWRENLKWVPLPGLVILLVFSIEKPEEPMPGSTDAYYYCLTAVVFGAALGFLQIFFEAHGDKRSLLLHRPLEPIAHLPGQGARRRQPLPAGAGDSFCLSGNLEGDAGQHAGALSLADEPSLAGGHPLGPGLLLRGDAHGPARARWYGSRGLALAAAFFCSYLVWALPEFWQALVAIGILGSFVGVAAWGSFLAGGEYATQPRLAKAALAMTFLAALLILSMLGKQMIGEWSDSGLWDYGVDRQGRVVVAPIGPLGPMGPYTDLNGQELPDLERPVFPAFDGKGIDDEPDSRPRGHQWRCRSTGVTAIAADSTSNTRTTRSQATKSGISTRPRAAWSDTTSPTISSLAASARTVLLRPACSRGNASTESFATARGSLVRICTIR